MRRLLPVILNFCLLTILSAFNQSHDASFKEICWQIEQKNFFKAKELYYSHQNELSSVNQKYTEAILLNAFNKNADSVKRITSIIGQREGLSKELQLKLYEVKYDNEVKQNKYSEAKNTISLILDEYKSLLNDEDIADFQNSLKIWTALQDTPAQKVVLHEMTSLEIEKDIAGLDTLKVSSNNQSRNFIFDTGANLSTTSQSVAKALGMKVIPVEIEVGTITGAKVKANIAVCEKLTLGNIDCFNVVFLVLPDSGLSFPQANYQIYGILGFPVFNGMKEIRITQDREFIVPDTIPEFTGKPNLAMDELTPLIYLNDKHFTFDTGANNTIFYHSFYVENQSEIDEKYTSEEIEIHGAAGGKMFDGYSIDYTFLVNGKETSLQGVHLLKDKISEDETVYGNIGQDLIKHFQSMTINFESMFIRFD